MDQEHQQNTFLEHFFPLYLKSIALHTQLCNFELKLNSFCSFQNELLLQKIFGIQRILLLKN